MEVGRLKRWASAIQLGKWPDHLITRPQFSRNEATAPASVRCIVDGKVGFAAEKFPRAELNSRAPIRGASLAVSGNERRTGDFDQLCQARPVFLILALDNLRHQLTQLRRPLCLRPRDCPQVGRPSAVPLVLNTALPLAVSLH